MQPEPATIERYRHSDQTGYAYNVRYEPRMVIRYNPGDKVHCGSWGRTESHGRKNAVGFRIHPGKDEWVFNYDELTVDDLTFYLTNRIERVHYARIMPFLYELRAQLQKELAWEQEFARVLARKVREEAGEALPAAVDVEALVHQAIKWYKLDKVKLKRSLTDNDAQALRLVEQRVRYYLRTQHGLKAIDAGVDYREKVLIWHHAETKRSFVATGMLKKEFVAECLDFVLVALPYRYLATSSRDKGKVTASRIEREMQVTTYPAALAQAVAGKIVELRGQGRPVTTAGAG
jgi:hypothetical protein